eukprot:100638-Chlamydomonas_euryale.AAC.2
MKGGGSASNSTAGVPVQKKGEGRLHAVRSSTSQACRWQSLAGCAHLGGGTTSFPSFWKPAAAQKPAVAKRQPLQNAQLLCGGGCCARTAIVKSPPFPRKVAAREGSC